MLKCCLPRLILYLKCTCPPQHAQCPLPCILCSPQRIPYNIFIIFSCYYLSLLAIMEDCMREGIFVSLFHCDIPAMPGPQWMLKNEWLSEWVSTKPMPFSLDLPTFHLLMVNLRNDYIIFAMEGISKLYYVIRVVYSSSFLIFFLIFSSHPWIQTIFVFLKVSSIFNKVLERHYFIEYHWGDSTKN